MKLFEQEVREHSDAYEAAKKAYFEKKEKISNGLHKKTINEMAAMLLERGIKEVDLEDWLNSPRGGYKSGCIETFETPEELSGKISTWHRPSAAVERLKRETCEVLLKDDMPYTWLYPWKIIAVKWISGQYRKLYHIWHVAGETKQGTGVRLFNSYVSQARIDEPMLLHSVIDYVNDEVIETDSNLFELLYHSFH